MARMKRFLLAFAFLIGWASAVWADATPTLTTLHAIHALTNPEASHALPVAFEATVTYYRDSDLDLFVQQDGEAVYVYFQQNAGLVPGDRVHVEGKTQDSFRPVVIGSRVTLLHHGDAPKPLQATFDQLIREQIVCMRVTVRAVVRSADLVWGQHKRTVYLQMLMDGGYIDAYVNSDDAGILKGLLDAEIEVTGVVGEKLDGKKQQVGIMLWVQSAAGVKVLKRAVAGPDSLPVTPMDKVLFTSHVHDLTQRVRVQGTITYYQPGSSIALQSGEKSLWIMTLTDIPMRIGDLADVTGFPDVRNGFLTLTHSEISDLQVQAPIPPRPVTWREVGAGSNAFDLVSVEGQLLMEVREASEDEYVFVSDGHLLSAIYRHPNPASVLEPPPMKQVALGSRIRVTGISMYYSSDPFNGPMASGMLLRSSDDIAVVAGPSLLSIRNLMLLVGLLLLFVFAVGAWGWAIERKARRQTAALANIEQRRRRILEDINGSLPLAEIIEQITALVSFTLNGVPCWCQIADGALLGNCPPNLTNLRIVRSEIPARTGSALGTVFAAFDPLVKPGDDEPEAISMAAGLAALAIENRRLYSDLLHRSEFDLLTDINNRFSLEKHMDALIEDARLKAGIFGLIYIDLDEFKQVNDLYGHSVGDLYLQEVTMRMKGQLRAHDTLARLGGDEFAILVTVIRNRAAAEEIAHRIERCFDEPFAVEGYVLHGSASVGLAIYPEDGATRDSLLSASDAAMYVAKHIKRNTATPPADQKNSSLTPKNNA
jgi:diguanylate cyclase (GGDEF)-like protein